MMETTPVRRRGAPALLVLGVVLIVAALVLAVLLRQLVVRYPDAAARDTTVDATGTLTLLVDPATLAPVAAPGRALPLALKRRVHTLDTAGGTAVVEADDALSIDNLPPQRFVQRYTIDQGSLRNVAASTPGFAFSPDNPVDRSPAYSVAFPFSAGSGPYAVWNDDAGQPVTYTASGTSTVDGLTVHRYHGVLDDGALQPALLDQLAPEGLTATTTFGQLRPQLTAAGVNVDHFLNVALRQLDQPDQQAVNAVLAAPIPLRYRLTVDSQLLVEPWTGTIVSRDHVDETLSERPDIAGIGRVYAIVTQPKYAAKPDVTAAATDLARLLATPPTTALIRETYAQTAPSVAAVAAAAGRWADRIILLTIVLPIVLGVLGLLVCLAAVWRWRRPGPRGHDATGPENRLRGEDVP